MLKKIIIFLLLGIIINTDKIHATSHILLNESLGVVYGENVRIRKDPNTSSRIITNLNSGDLVKILDKTSKPVRLIKSREFHYHWYMVEYSPGKSAWIYGQFLYRYLDTFNDKAKSFNFKGTKFKLLLFREQEVQLEQPEQDIYTMPCLYDIKLKKAYPLEINPSLYKKLKYRINSYKRSPFLYIEGDLSNNSVISGSSIIIKGRNAGFGTGTIDITYDMNVVLKDGRFRIVEIHNYKGGK